MATPAVESQRLLSVRRGVLRQLRNLTRTAPGTSRTPRPSDRLSQLRRRHLLTPEFARGVSEFLSATQHTPRARVLRSRIIDGRFILAVLVATAKATHTGDKS